MGCAAPFSRGAPALCPCVGISASIKACRIAIGSDIFFKHGSGVCRRRIAQCEFLCAIFSDNPQFHSPTRLRPCLRSHKKTVALLCDNLILRHITAYRSLRQSDCPFFLRLFVRGFCFFRAKYRPCGRRECVLTGLDRVETIAIAEGIMYNPLCLATINYKFTETAIRTDGGTWK